MNEHASASTALSTAGTAAGAKDRFIAFWDPIENVYDTAAYNQGF